MRVADGLTASPSSAGTTRAGRSPRSTASTTSACRSTARPPSGKPRAACLTTSTLPLCVRLRLPPLVSPPRTRCYVQCGEETPALTVYTLAQIIDGAVLCVHGGLSPDIRTLDQIRVLSRAQEIPHEGAFCGTRPRLPSESEETNNAPSSSLPGSLVYPSYAVRRRADLMWSDPEDVENWAVSPRGAGWLFGASVTKEVRALFSNRPSRTLFCHLAVHVKHASHHADATAVQPHERALAHRARAPARAGGLQAPLRRAARDRLVRAELLLPLRECGEHSDHHRRRRAPVDSVRRCARERARPRDGRPADGECPFLPGVRVCEGRR
jgi:diadenosine tetraphosphatase ApaH/serine/threonine PP2A family protein phosphatase